MTMNKLMNLRVAETAEDSVGRVVSQHMIVTHGQMAEQETD